MMIALVLWMGCEEPPTPSPTYQTTKQDTGISDTGSSDTGDTSVEDTAETEVVAQKIHFKTTNISCEELSNFAISLTQITPGGLELEADDDDDVRNDLLANVDLEYLRIDANSFLDLEKDDLNPSKGCIFSIDLPTDIPINLQDIVLFGEDDDDIGTGGMWSFYAITLITNEKIACQDPTSELISCSLVPQPPMSEMDYTTTDPTLEDGDIYVWMSDSYLSYTTGTLSPSLLGMGFQNGWNLAEVSGGTIDVAENLQPEMRVDDVDMMPLSITLSDLIPEYAMSLSIENDWSNSVCDMTSTQCYKNQIGLRPASWMIFGTTASSIGASYKNLYYNGYGVSTLTGSLELQVWGIPSNEYYFSGDDILTESDEFLFFQQWGDFVDVAVKAPIVYSDGIYYPQENKEEWVSKNSTPVGAFCRGTERVVFVYYAAADEISEVLWYKFSNTTPGWKVLYGTQEQIDTWRFMLPSTISTTDYTNIQISAGCSVPDWQ